MDARIVSTASGNGYWLNFGGVAPRLLYDDGNAVGRLCEPADLTTNRRLAEPAYNSGQWKLVVEATMFVTNETVIV